MNKKIFKMMLVVGLVLGLVGVRSYLNRQSEKSQGGKVHVVVLEEGGFLPENITINKGDVIEFKTKLGKNFWPASNLHPSHDIFPEFDPRKPVSPDTTWSFRFEKPGEWKYHDHLAPSYRGTILVLDEKGDEVKVDCNLNEELQQCWEREITSALKEEGIKEAFTTLAYLYETQPQFAQNCHGLVHILGEEGYRHYSLGNKFELPREAAYCGYGFYHGFMEKMALESGNMTKAGDFCRELRNRGTAKVGWSCFHGLGHGTVDGDSDVVTSDVLSYVKPGLEVCNIVGETREERDMCATGVFNALAIAQRQGRVPVNKSKPYDHCELVGEDYFKRGCYEEMNTLVFYLGANDFGKSANLVKTVRGVENQKIAIEHLAAYWAAFVKDSNYEPTIKVCRSLGIYISTDCLLGFIGGLEETGSPGREHLRPLEFCRNGLLTSGERDSCFGRAISVLPLLYPPERVKAICEGVEDDYQRFCDLVL